MIENEQVHVLNKRNVERIVTYVIKSESGSGLICLNGSAALKFTINDVVILVSYAAMEFELAKKHTYPLLFSQLQQLTN